MVSSKSTELYDQRVIAFIVGNIWIFYSKLESDLVFFAISLYFVIKKHILLLD